MKTKTLVFNVLPILDLYYAIGMFYIYLRSPETDKDSSLDYQNKQTYLIFIVQFGDMNEYK